MGFDDIESLVYRTFLWGLLCLLVDLYGYEKESDTKTTQLNH